MAMHYRMNRRKCHSAEFDFSSLSVNRDCLTVIIQAEATPSFLWFAAIQDIKRTQDLTSLAQKGCFIA
jgi:hypothetical protein